VTRKTGRYTATRANPIRNNHNPKTNGNIFKNKDPTAKPHIDMIPLSDNTGFFYSQKMRREKKDDRNRQTKR
jgi:hypothetical protein